MYYRKLFQKSASKKGLAKQIEHKDHNELKIKSLDLTY